MRRSRRVAASGKRIQKRAGIHRKLVQARGLRRHAVGKAYQLRVVENWEPEERLARYARRLALSEVEVLVRKAL